MKLLHLVLKRQWYDMILSGEKRDEYRDITPYWRKRLEGKDYDVVEFRNGYQKDARRMRFEIQFISRGYGHEMWGAPGSRPVYIIGIGAQIDC